MKCEEMRADTFMNETTSLIIQSSIIHLYFVFSSDSSDWCVNFCFCKDVFFFFLSSLSHMICICVMLCLCFKVTF